MDLVQNLYLCRPTPGANAKAYVGRLSAGIDFAKDSVSVRCD